MRRRIVCVASLVFLLGCSRILGINFDEYKEGDAGKGGAQLECVPGEISRCLCELDEGLRTCDDAGHSGACVCGEAGARPTSTACGNGLLDPNEACDDGNAIDGDGCSSTCSPDGRPAPVEQCPGQSVFVWSGNQVAFLVSGSVRTAVIAADAGDDGGAPSCGTSPQPDRVFALTSNIATTLQIVVTPSVPTFVSARTTCEIPSSAVSCALAPNDVPSMLSVPVTPGQLAYLILEPIEASPTATFSIQIASQ